MDIILIQLTCNVSHALQAQPQQEQQQTHTLDLIPIVRDAMCLLVLVLVKPLWFAPLVLEITNGIQETLLVSIAEQEQIQEHH